VRRPGEIGQASPILLQESRNDPFQVFSERLRRDSKRRPLRRPDLQGHLRRQSIRVLAVAWLLKFPQGMLMEAEVETRLASHRYAEKAALSAANSRKRSYLKVLDSSLL